MENRERGSRYRSRHHRFTFRNGSSVPDTGPSDVHPSLKPSTQPSVAPTSVLPNADKSQEKAGKGSNMLAKTGASILGLLIAAILFTLAGFGLVSWRRKN